MRGRVRVQWKLLAISASLFVSSHVQAGHPDQFAYTFVTTPEEGPRDLLVEKRLTREFWTCQEHAVSTQENEACFTRELARQNRTLDWTWHTTLARIARPSHEKLLVAQRRWEAQRDTFCMSQSEAFHEGTIAPVVYMDCRVEQTIRRTMWLERLR